MANNDAVDQAYALLSVEQARVFRLLGLHPGPEFGLAAAATLTGLDQKVAHRSLNALAELNFVEVIGDKRYLMKDQTYAYATRQVELGNSPDDREEAVQRVLSWYAHTARKADEASCVRLSGATPDEIAPVGIEVTFANRDEALDWLHLERTTLVAAARSAARAGLHEIVMTLAVYCRFLSMRGAAWSALELEATELGITSAKAVGNKAVEALLLSLRASTLKCIDRLDEAEVAISRALALAVEIQSPARQVSGLSGLGSIRRQQGRLPEAVEYYQQSAGLAHDSGQLRSEAVSLCNLSGILVELGEFERALDYAEQTLVLRQQAGDLIGEAGAHCDAALAWQGLGQHDTTIDLCRQAIASYETLRYAGIDLSETLLTLATSLEHVGNHAEAATNIREAITVLTQLGNPQAEQVRERLAALEARFVM